MNPFRVRLFLIMLCAAMMTWAAACSPPIPDTIRVTRDISVMKDVTDGVAIGPRFAGSPGAEKTVKWIVERIRSMGRTAVIDEFTDKTPLGSVVPFRNVILDIPGTGKDFIIVGTHYDTKYFPPEMPFEGANDGASGVAALLAMIRAMDGVTLPVGVKFMFFDGEEARFDYQEKDGLHGSRHAVEQLRASNALSRCRAMILLDMIGDRDLCMALPADTHESLADTVRQAAKNIQAESCLSRLSVSMLDDHIPFQNAGIPSVDLIDFQYGPGNAYWHTSQDSLDKISAESICTAADLALETIRLLAKENAR